MAASSFHARSNSFPSTPHPLISLVEQLLSRLRTSEFAYTSSSLNQNLNNILDLHDSVDKLLHLPSTQQAVHKEHINELLDGSLRLLDLCNSAKDSLLQTKACIQEVQSILRRRRGSGMELAKEVNNYLSSKKTTRKAILKALKDLKHKENKHNTSSELIGILREVEAATFRVLGSLLSFIAGPEAERKKSHLSSVSKLLHNKKVECKEEQSLNEIVNAETTFLFLAKVGSDKVNIEEVQNELQNSESCIQDLKEGTDVLYRHLVKARVGMLNILN